MKIVDQCYEKFLNNKYRKKNKLNGVIFSKECIVSRDCVFEGNNYIAGELSGCFMGYGSYIHKNSVLKNVKIGKFTAIGENVNIRLFQHPTDMVSISPCFYRNDFMLKSFVRDNRFEDLGLAESGEGYSVIIGNDVWIGEGVSIKSGLKIGDGAVIGTGAVVTKDVEPYAIVAGVPAKLIRYRFSAEQIEALQRIKWWDHSIEWFEENGEYFDDITGFINRFADIHSVDL